MTLPEVLIAGRPRFVSFVRSRITDRAAAEDIVHGAYARAVARGVPEDPSGAVRWFYRVLLNAVTDFHRRQAAQVRGLERFRQDAPKAAPGESRRLCGCVRRALEALPPRYRTILQRVEVEGASVALAAAEVGITSGNGSVRLHRARRLLGDRLRNICGACSLDGCADCDCGAARAAGNA